MREKAEITENNTYEGRKYNDEGERAAACNSSLIVGMTIYYVVIGIYAGIALSQGIQRMLEYFVIIMSIAFGILSWAAFIKYRHTARFSIIVTYAYLFAYIVTFIIAGYDFVQFSIFALLIIAILFYNVRQLLIFSIITGVTNAAHLVMWLIDFSRKNQGIKFSQLSQEAQNEQLYTIFSFIIMLCLLYTVVRTADRGRMFSRDIVGTISDEQEKQAKMLEDVLAIAGVIRENTTASNEIVQELEDSTGVVNMAIGQIAASTQLTAQNIQEQNLMTQSIQSSIQDTVSRSKKMVGIAQESGTSINSNLELMNDLRNESEEIALTNKELIDSMTRLQLKMKEVRDIAAIIHSISGQTNLLALNASIESARAGEAGKGFAVVADQIRKLAEQTKSSTENISRILEDLNSYTEAATKTVYDTIHATNHQSELITITSKSFNQINANVGLLTEDIANIDEMLLNLAKANSTIVENISQISATTEEVTASSQEATAISEKNMHDAESAKSLLDEILETSYRLDKYMGE